MEIGFKTGTKENLVRKNMISLAHKILWNQMIKLKRRIVGLIVEENPS